MGARRMFKKCALVCLVVWAASAVSHSSAAEAPSGKLTVHEWGTFTSFAGSNGVKLEFRPLVDSDLPPFVLNRWSQDGAFNPLTGFSKSSVSARQRMETPVIYFYSDVERQVRVKVGFPQGLITEFYPPVASHQPPVNFKTSEAIGNSVIDWGNVWIIPRASLAPHVAHAELEKSVEQRILKSLPPRVFVDDHYGGARETDSSIVYVNRPADPSNAQCPAGDFFEKFLFYRGIGNFDLPLTVQALGNDEFVVKNSGQEPIHSLFLVNVTGNNVRFSRYDQVASAQNLKMTLPKEVGTVDGLADAVIQALVDDKLYEKEARAMVATWKTSWFGEEGTRLFYLLPQQVTDKLLPLDMSPKPDELVRVLVGRMEVMTPETEKQMTSLVRGYARQRAIIERDASAKSVDIASVQPQLPQSIRRLGRLAEPMLTRVKETATEESVRKEAGILLAQLQSAMSAAEQALK